MPDETDLDSHHGAIPLPMAQAMTFRAFQPEHPDPEQLERIHLYVDYIHRWAHSPHGWLLITGNYGAGKTHLAVAALQHCPPGQKAPYFATTIELIARLREASAPGHAGPSPEEISTRAMNAPIALFDDFGAERSTEFAIENLTRILAHRYDHRLNTIITTNLSPTEIQRSRPRLASRLTDHSLVTSIPLTAPDYRSLV